VTPKISALSYKELLVHSVGMTSHSHKNTAVQKIFNYWTIVNNLVLRAAVRSEEVGRLSVFTP